LISRWTPILVLKQGKKEFFSFSSFWTVMNFPVTPNLIKPLKVWTTFKLTDLSLSSHFPLKTVSINLKEALELLISQYGQSVSINNLSKGIFLTTSILSFVFKEQPLIPMNKFKLIYLFN
jgi:hypothetical protein